MIAVVPGYISRSVAGSYDNEGIPLICTMMSFKGNITKWIVNGIPPLSYSGIAIFCMLLTYYMWIKAVKTGSVYWSSICALAYFYMVRRFKRVHVLRNYLWVYRGPYEVFFCVSRFPPGVATCSWSTLSPSTSWSWCSQDDSPTASTWLTAQFTAWAPSCPCRSLLLVSR